MEQPKLEHSKPKKTAYTVTSPFKHGQGSKDGKPKDEKQYNPGDTIHLSSEKGAQHLIGLGKITEQVKTEE